MTRAIQTRHKPANSILYSLPVVVATGKGHVSYGHIRVEFRVMCLIVVHYAQGICILQQLTDLGIVVGLILVLAFAMCDIYF